MERTSALNKQGNKSKMRIENAFNIANPVLHVKEKLVACFVSFQLINAGKLLNKYNFPKQAIGFAGREYINTHLMCYTHIHTII